MRKLHFKFGILLLAGFLAGIEPASHGKNSLGVFPRPAQLAFALQTAVGSGGVTTPAGGARSACDETPAQAKFAGLPRARPFSEHIWVVDGGKPWPTGRPWQVKWLVLGSGHDLQIQVIAKGPGNSRKVLVNAPMSPLSAKEYRGLQPGARAGQNAYLLSAPVVVPVPGCIELGAVVTRGRVKAAVYRGHARVPAL